MKRTSQITTAALVAGLLAADSAQAATITVLDNNAGNATAPPSVSLNNGNASGSFNVSGADVTVLTAGEDTSLLNYGITADASSKSYSIVGLDFDGDSLSDTLNYTINHTGPLTGVNSGNGPTVWSFSDVSIVNSAAGFVSTVDDIGFTAFWRNRDRNFTLKGTTDGSGPDITTTNSGANSNGNNSIDTVTGDPESVFHITSGSTSGYSYTALAYTIEVSTVPEPGSLALLGLGGLLIARRRR